MSAGPTDDRDRGLTGAVWTAQPRPPLAARPARLLTPAVAASTVVLVAAAATSLGWAVQHGGLALPSRPAGAVAGLTAAPGDARGGETAATSPAPSAATAALATPAVSSARPSLAPTPGPSPTSDRYALLVACPGVSDCYRYTVRAGDNLWSIARWFGVSLDDVYDRNPGLQSTPLRRGMQINLPTPTR